MVRNLLRKQGRREALRVRVPCLPLRVPLVDLEASRAILGLSVVYLPLGGVATETCSSTVERPSQRREVASSTLVTGVIWLSKLDDVAVELLKTRNMHGARPVDARKLISCS
jgi:hypothetical protein